MTQFATAKDLVVSSPLPRAPAVIIDELRDLEDLKCAAEARQARLAVALDAIRISDTKPGESEPHSKPAVHAEIALARRVSPHRGRRLLSLARYLHGDLPHIRSAFEAGLISEWRVTVIAKETACLRAADRAEVDRTLGSDADALSGRSDRDTEALARSLAARLDAASVAQRRRRAESERRVSIRPAPDTMVYLTALLPVATGVGVFAALKAAAATAVGVGAATNIGNVMADELVRRVTGAPDSPDTGLPIQAVALRLTISDYALFDHSDDPALLADFGPIPAEAARAMVADNLAAGTKVWLKRLYTRPASGELAAMDSHARLFPTALGEFLDIRDRFCRHPFCGAPIRHHDHITSHAAGGPTTAANGQGLCADCNATKQAPGWRATAPPGEPGVTAHTVVITTPTGHRHRSRAPA